MAGLGFLSPLWATVVQQRIPEQVLARVSSYDWLLSLAAMPVGYALTPIAADHWGPAAPLVIAAVLVAGSCLATAAVPDVRRVGLDAVAPVASSPSTEPPRSGGPGPVESVPPGAQSRRASR
jgi:hypothetical protein